MENLMTVVKEANKEVGELKKKWKTNDDVVKHYTPFYERVKEQCSPINFFITICIQDHQLNLSGGTIV